MRGKNDADAAKAAALAAAAAETVSTPLTSPAPVAAAMADTVAGPIVEQPIRREGAATIGRFLLLRKLGEGGMGEVFSGYDEQLDRKVAIKVLHAATAPEETQKRTLREAQALARLSHPNVVTVHEVGQVDGDVFVVMEHIDGATLRDWQDAEPRTITEILEAYLMAGRGLSAVHAAGMVHRDFKPHNAMIDREGRVRILDFGLAHARGVATAAPQENAAAANALTSELTAEGAIVGTPAYMSPEQFMGTPLDARTDQFSFCVALYEALYKKLPAAPNSASPNALPALASSLAPPPARDDIPSHVSDAIMRGLSWDPAARFPDMDGLLEMLEVAPPVDPSGQTRQRLLFAAILLAFMGVWMLVPKEFLQTLAPLHLMLLLAVTGNLIVPLAAFIFRNTLLRNPFHRTRVIFLMVMSMAVLVSRVMGIMHRDTALNVVVRDMFLTVTGITLGALMLVPRVVASWVALIIAVVGVTVLAFFPQYVAEIATMTMNTALVAFLVSWHRSARVKPPASSPRIGTAGSTTRRNQHAQTTKPSA